MRKEQRVTRTTYPDGSSISYDLNEPTKVVTNYDEQPKVKFAPLVMLILAIMFIFVGLVFIAMVAQNLNKI
jgi:hypothetical protein